MIKEPKCQWIRAWNSSSSTRIIESKRNKMLIIFEVLAWMCAAMLLKQVVTFRFDISPKSQPRKIVNRKFHQFYFLKIVKIKCPSNDSTFYSVLSDCGSIRPAQNDSHDRSMKQILHAMNRFVFSQHRIWCMNFYDIHFQTKEISKWFDIFFLSVLIKKNCCCWGHAY